jgi:hypothetical protein
MERIVLFYTHIQEVIRHYINIKKGPMLMHTSVDWSYLGTHAVTVKQHEH